MGAATKDPAGQSRDESRLAELGYKQELSRSWVDPGHKTGTAGNKASKSSRAMTETTAG